MKEASHKRFHLYEIPRIGKTIKTKNRLVVAYSRGMEVLGSYKSGVSFWGKKNVLKLIVVIAAQLREYIKSHWTVHFKWVNYNLYVDYIPIKLLSKRKFKGSYQNQHQKVIKSNNVTPGYSLNLVVHTLNVSEFSASLWDPRAGNLGSLFLHP